MRANGGHVGRRNSPHDGIPVSYTGNIRKTRTYYQVCLNVCLQSGANGIAGCPSYYYPTEKAFDTPSKPRQSVAWIVLRVYRLPH